MDNLQVLQRMFSESEGKRVGVGFIDSDYRNLIIVSDSHVMLDGTVWGVPLTPEGEEVSGEMGIQFHLQDVEQVYDFDTKHLLFGPEITAAKNTAQADLLRNNL